MKKSVARFICVSIMALIMAACGNTDSKVNQVIHNQIQGGNSANQSGNINIPNGWPGLTNEEKEPGSQSGTQSGNVIDVDLTKLSSTMVYAEVYNMMISPERYVGKKVRMQGVFVVYTNLDDTQFYPAVIITDATACCAQGLEFVLQGDPQFPEGYPVTENEICVCGTFETYEEDGDVFCRLKDAWVE